LFFRSPSPAGEFYADDGSSASSSSWLMYTQTLSSMSSPERSGKYRLSFTLSDSRPTTVSGVAATAVFKIIDIPQTVVDCKVRLTLPVGYFWVDNSDSVFSPEWGSSSPVFNILSSGTELVISSSSTASGGLTISSTGGTYTFTGSVSIPDKPPINALNAVVVQIVSSDDDVADGSDINNIATGRFYSSIIPLPPVKALADASALPSTNIYGDHVMIFFFFL
jgi:hypothetical protein